MALLKEDGNLDIEQYRKLSIEEFTKEYNRLSRKQIDEFWDKQSLNESSSQTKEVIVDYTLEDDLNNGAVIATDFLNKMRQKYENI